MPKNNTTRKNVQQYKKMYKMIKSYINYDIDLRKPLTRGNKQIITKYFKEFARLTDGKPYDIQLYRSKKKDRLTQVQQLAGQDTKLKLFKVAFVPKTSPQQKIRFNKDGEPYVKSVYVKATFIPLDPERLAEENPSEYVNSLIGNREEKSFSIQAGDYEIPATYSKDVIGKAVSKLCLKYNNEDSNNYFANWLGGIFANKFDNQSSLDEYRNAKRDAQIKKDRSAKKRDSKKRIKLFYWYDRKADTVLLTKTETAPNNHCEAITKREYERFLKIGEI